MGEAIINVLKHAYSPNMENRELAKYRVRYLLYPNKLVIVVKDFGKGFNPDFVLAYVKRREAKKPERAGTGEEALRGAKEYSPHLITVDINLPGMNGFEFTRILRKVYPQVQVIFISINGDPVLRLEADLLGCSYIPKESLLEELPGVLESIDR